MRLACEDHEYNEWGSKGRLLRNWRCASLVELDRLRSLLSWLWAVVGNIAGRSVQGGGWLLRWKGVQRAVEDTVEGLVPTMELLGNAEWVVGDNTADPVQGLRSSLEHVEPVEEDIAVQLEREVVDTAAALERACSRLLGCSSAQQVECMSQALLGVHTAAGADLRLRSHHVLLLLVVDTADCSGLQCLSGSQMMGDLGPEVVHSDCKTSPTQLSRW